MTAPVTDHVVEGTPFFIRSKPGRCQVYEAGAGRRGMAKLRGTCRSLPAAEALAATLAPSTVQEVLDACHDRPAGYLMLLRLGQPGTRLWVIPGDDPGFGYEAVSDGICANGTEAMFGEEAWCWQLRWHALDGTPGEGMYAVAFEDAERAWWIVRDGRVVAGGPPIYSEDRARELELIFSGKAVPGTVATGRAA